MKVIKKTVLLNYTRPVYDLSIKDNHNYFITKSDILVHNSGKSYVLSKITSGSIEPRIVNVDTITEFLNIHNPLSVYDRSKKIHKNQLAQYLNGVLPLFVDMVGVNVTRMRDRVSVLERLGYDVALVFINTSLETSQARALKRTRKVDPKAVEDMYNKTKITKEQIKQFFSFTIEINNNDGDLTDDVILKTYKKISYFFDTEIQNPIGQEREQLMRENNWKYLDPNIVSINDIKHMVKLWYGK